MQNNKANSIRTKERVVFAGQRSFFSLILPVLLFISFVWLNFYDTTAELNILSVNFAGMDNLALNIGLSVFVSGLIDYVIFEFLFFIYRFCLGFSIYSFMIPKFVIMDKFRLWYVVRNILLGLIFNVRFFFPFIGTYLCAIELVCNFVLIICLYYSLQKEYVEPLVGQFVFKTLAVPVVLYEIYQVIVLMVGVL